MSLLIVENVTHGFGGRRILEDASFRLLKGEHVGLIGANGEGKSTMIKAIMGATSTTGKAMNAKTALVLKDNAGVAMDADLVGGGATAPAILEVWFPGQEDGNIVAEQLPDNMLDLLFQLDQKSPKQ